jgi:2-oxoglutarate dehydrogenase E1 component
LRHKKNTSSLDQFVNGSTFHRVLSDRISKDLKNKIDRIILCSGKIYFELQDRINELDIKNIHIVRVEQLYPFPYEALEEELQEFKNCEIFWCQEEPKNMGAWQFVEQRIHRVLLKIGIEKKLHFIGRRAAASPATGAFDRHLQNQKNIIRLATKAKLEEIKSEESGVSLRKYKLPIE